MPQLSLSGLFAILFAILVLAVIDMLTKRPPVLVKSGRVAYVDFSAERIHHSGTHRMAYYLLCRTTVVFEDGNQVVLNRSGSFWWKAGTELSIFHRGGSHFFSVEPQVDYSVSELAVLKESFVGF